MVPFRNLSWGSRRSCLLIRGCKICKLTWNPPPFPLIFDSSACQIATVLPANLIKCTLHATCIWPRNFYGTQSPCSQSTHVILSRQATHPAAHLQLKERGKHLGRCQLSLQ